MSELRWDPIEGDWALIATERGLRPTDFAGGWRTAPRDGAQAPCPFCLIAAGKAPATFIAERRPRVRGTDATVRGQQVNDRVLVVANRFPALSVEASSERRAVGPYDRVEGVGAHEVVIETTAHDAPLGALPVEHIAEVLLAWRDRVADLIKDRRIQHVQVFKNDGPRAGATLEHAHSQVLAAPIRPPRVARRMERMHAHWDQKERCLVCDIIQHELTDKARLVAVSEELAVRASSTTIGPGFVAWCPYASRHPFEVCIAPRRHSADFMTLASDDALELAQVVKSVLLALGQALRDADLNLSLSLLPSPRSFARELDGLTRADQWWHWQLEIVPRIMTYGGYELSTGVVINPTAPEDAAAHLRHVIASARLPSA